jgi:hypothetical protein
LERDDGSITGASGVTFLPAWFCAVILRFQPSRRRRASVAVKSEEVMAILDPAVARGLTWRDWRPIAGAAGLALVVCGGLLVVFNGVATYDRPTVLQGLVNSVFWLASSMIGACGTIAALVLTTVGLLERLETRRLSPRFLFHLRLIVRAALVTIALAVITLLLTVFPTSGTAEVTTASWQADTVYWAILVATSLMISGFTTVLGSLFVTINEILGTLPQEWVDDILATEEQRDDVTGVPER